MVGTAIEEYALLSDRRSAALVSRDGSVDWLCFPRFDSPSLFAALLDDDAGSWSIRPAGPATATRRYLTATMVLETRFRAADGTLTVTDALATGGDRDPHALGAHAPHLLVRSVACLDGAVDVQVRFRPRPEYGLVVPLLVPVDGGINARGGPASTVLSSPVPLTIDEGAAHGTVRLRAGQTVRFALHWGPLDGQRPRAYGDAELGGELDRTVRAWRAWSELHQNYQGPWRDEVHHSGCVLQALSYQPTGAIVAAPTTSLPETVGGERNWDYRYTWIRDASFTMDALWVAACPDEAAEFFAFMTTATATPRAGARLQIMYGIAGEHDLSERVLPHLSGWRGSRPVRVGNGAWSQQQLDVAGELLATAALFADRLDAADPTLRAFLPNLAETVTQVWREADYGIWEVRGAPQHFLYSKLMCWAALDRAVTLADRLGAGERTGGWRAARDEIRATILRDGWNDRIGAYTQAFGSDALDASALLLPIVGFLPADDPRMRATVEAIAAGLTDERGLLYRYRPELGLDGLSGREGAFLPCTFWLAHVHALAGDVDAARRVFGRAVGYANDVGLLAEEVDPATGALLGNFPQAFSHIGLVNAAWAIAQAESRARSGNGA
ncbi:glycoside hydrolase family 15 protein [Micromonospora pattaloongensis]|uniref:glycoside hydrolase family 15 protein n=1 Tax=Micromonospora pattaloongensis TaxID=405436 RepID=UPI000B8985C7|nr:glycoside hydrolase family 15 protein [Micromonospora pattaloongensis]